MMDGKLPKGNKQLIRKFDSPSQFLCKNTAAKTKKENRKESPSSKKILRQLH